MIVFSFVGLLAGVDFASVVDVLKSADLRLLVLGLLVAPLAQVFFFLSTLGASIRRLPFLPVLMLQYRRPVRRARPAGHRRPRRPSDPVLRAVGVSYGAATAMGALDSVGGFVVQVLLFLLIWASSLSGATTSVTTGFDSSGEESSDP